MFLEILLAFALVTHGRTQGHYADGNQSEMPEEYGKSSKRNILKRDDDEFAAFEMEPVNLHDLNSCKMCGLDRFPPETDIPTGKETKIGPIYRYNWIVALQHQRRKFCAGALITEQFILTSAHCLIENKGALETLQKLLINETDENLFRTEWLSPLDITLEHIDYLKPENITIGFLTHSFFVDIIGPPVEKVIPHPKFDAYKVHNDIGLLKLKEKLICNKFRNPICLPPHNTDVKKGKMFYVSGWDMNWKATYYKIELWKPLRRLQVKYVDFLKNCRFNFPRRLEKDYYCVENTSGDEKNCHADPGGPLFSKEHDKYYVFGVASVFAYDVCKKGKAFMYTPVLDYLDWINENLGLPSPGSQEKCSESKGKCKKH